jgi:hypothetical protein
MDKVQKHNSFNTNTPSSESYRNHLSTDLDDSKFSQILDVNLGLGQLCSISFNV